MLVIFLPANTRLEARLYSPPSPSQYYSVLTHRVDGIVLLGLGEVEGIDLLWPHVFLPNDPSVDIVLHHDPADGPHLVEAVVVVDLVVEAVHPILVDGQTSQQG